MRSPLLLLLLGLCLTVGLYSLFRARFETGDIYPRYSSLRSDPLGTMALFESLNTLPGVRVKRDFTDVNRLPSQPGTTYLHLAARAGLWTSLPQSLFREAESFLLRGGRLVITFQPEFREPSALETDSDTDPDDSPDEDPPITLADRWGLKIAFAPSGDPGSTGLESAEAELQPDLPLPEALEWHGGTILTNLDSRWKVIYTRADAPVIVERHFGKGSIVFATDSYFLSNEALRSDRQPELLAWLVGPARQVVFDEAHLGIVEEVGVSTLMRRYRLYGVVFAALVLAGLFIWKNALPLVPPREEEQSPDFLQGREISAGFVNLLRRHIPPGNLLKVCFAEYEKSHQTATRSGARAAQAKAVPPGWELARAVLETQEALPARRRDPVQAYSEIARHLSRKPFTVSKPPTDVPPPAQPKS